MRRNGLLPSLNTLIDCLLVSLINSPNISSVTREHDGRLLIGMNTEPYPLPADLEQIELETPSVGGSTDSWAPCFETGLDLLQRKSSPKVCINTNPPPTKLGQPVPLVSCQGCNSTQTVAGKCKCGLGHDSSKVGS